MDTYAFIGNKLLAVVKLFALIWVLQKGNLIRTHYFKSILIFLSFVIVGALFKLMHWPYGNEMLLTGLFAVAVIYCVWFFHKPKKTVLDVAKLAWVVTAYLGAGLAIMHWLYGREVVVVAEVLFWVMFLLFAFDQFKASPKSTRNDASNR